MHPKTEASQDKSEKSVGLATDDSNANLAQAFQLSPDNEEERTPLNIPKSTVEKPDFSCALSNFKD